jgi:DNA polymerase IV
MRTILHIDMDCFYAAIEMRDRPELAGKPIAVGGAIDRRGVLTTCNYEARRFGVKSAMPTFLALKKCPHLVVVPVRFEVYRAESRTIRGIFHRYTEQVEPLSLDEAYLDVSGDPRGGWELARAIRAAIQEETGLTASAGVGPNKLIAKIASDWRKPNGQFAVAQHEVIDFMAPLPVGRLWGVGPVAADRMERRGLKTCADLQRLQPQVLLKMFGRFGWDLYELCRGIDRRPVEPYRPAKSMSTERTFDRDLVNIEECQMMLGLLLADLFADLSRLKKPRSIERLFVKLKFADFSKTSVERGGERPEENLYRALLDEGFARGGKPVRLLGVGVRFREAGLEQLELPLSRQE